MKSSIGYYKKIFDEIENGKIYSLYLFVGSERYLMEEALQRLVSRCVPDKSGFNLTSVHADDVEMGDFISSASSFPFLSDRKICILRGIERLKGGWKKLLEYCNAPVPSTTLILLCNQTDEWGRRLPAGRNLPRLISIVDAKGRVMEFGHLREQDVVKWVRSRLKSSGIKADDNVISLFVRSVGEDLFELKSEIDKMATLFDEGYTLREEDLGKTLGAQRVETIFNLVERIAPTSEKIALGSLMRVLSSGLEPPSRLLYRLIRHFMSLLKIKAGIEGGDYRMRRLRKQSDLFSVRDILIWLENLRKVDIIMKSTSFPEDELLITAFSHSMNGKLLSGVMEELQ